MRFYLIYALFFAPTFIFAAGVFPTTVSIDRSCGSFIATNQFQSLFKKLNLVYLKHSVQELDREDTFEIAAKMRPVSLQMEISYHHYIARFGGVQEARMNAQKLRREVGFNMSNLSDAEIRLLYADDIETGMTADVSVKFVNKKIGRGVFANRKLLKGEFIGEYAGVYRESKPSDVDNHYIFDTPIKPYVIDAKDEGNVTRFINHSVEHENSYALATVQNNRWVIFFVTAREIAAGEQILFDYGDDYWMPPGRRD